MIIQSIYLWNIALYYNNLLDYILGRQAQEFNSLNRVETLLEY